VTGLSLSRALREFPDITLEKVEYLTNLADARKQGVLSIPTLVSGDKRLRGIVLGKSKICRFLEALETERSGS
jgi:hypothetical protein